MNKKEHAVILENIRALLLKNASSTPDNVQRFFKTSPGSYGEKDKFLGIKVPIIRKIAKAFIHVPLEIVSSLLSSEFNEERLLALFILTHHYQKADSCRKDVIYTFYLQHLSCVNNWNLVDSSAHLILGAHLHHQDKSLLEELANSEILWHRRIAIVATWYFIRKSEVKPTFHLARILLKDSHDLIHKAVGWMLREAGKRNESLLIEFLNQHAAQMPRTMLRYAIEKLSKEHISRFLSAKHS